MIESMKFIHIIITHITMLITLLIRAEIMAFFEIEIIDESCFCLEKDLVLTFTVTFLYSIFSDNSIHLIVFQ